MRFGDLPIERADSFGNERHHHHRRKLRSIHRVAKCGYDRLPKISADTLGALFAGCVRHDFYFSINEHRAGTAQLESFCASDAYSIDDKHIHSQTNANKNAKLLLKWK